MRFRHMRQTWIRLGILGIVGALATGCVIQDPPAIVELGKARTAIEEAKKKGAQERFPAEFADLEKRHLAARGVFYACMDDKALQLAQALIADANALANRQLVRAVPPPPAPTNQDPIARLSAPREGEVRIPVTLDASASSDPDGDSLTYAWDFGDGTTERSAPARLTHTYAKPGNYPVRVTVDDGKGAFNTASANVAIIQRITLSETKERVLFDFDKATLKPAAREQLAEVVMLVREQPTLRVELVGHADSVGSDQYNLGLSKRRAEAVKNYLVSQGINAANISVDWKGESQPLVPNTTAENRARNRRVEITLRPQSVQ